MQIVLKERGILSVGTLRANRLRKRDLLSEKILKKKGRRSFDCKYDEKTGVSVVRWFDNRAVTLS
jgi:hypothetical protein